MPARRRIKPVTVSVAEAKKSLSELLGRVAYGKETITILKRGKPMAKLVPTIDQPGKHLADVKGWLDDDDPFFKIMEEITSRRSAPRSAREIPFQD